MKIVTVLGARPQFIKAATVSRELSKLGIQEVIVHTGQHFDANMSQVFFDEMEIPTPHYNLDISGLHHGAMTGRMLEKIEEVLLNEKPDHVLVYGDTNSTLAGALAATKLHISLAHVEAGLRSFEMTMPEEINRILTDRISQLLFCPTEVAVSNLKKEGFDHFSCEIEQPGDVMYDAVLHYQDKADKQSTILQRLAVKKENYVLATIHRAENTNDPGRLLAICNSLNEIHQSIPVVLPLHPRTRKFISSLNYGLNVMIVEPLGYFDMLALIKNCKLVMTDSGGLQKEAYFFHKFCMTLRDQTEWTELTTAGVNFLVGANQERIMNRFGLLEKSLFPETTLLYGKGNASELIAKKMKNS